MQFTRTDRKMRELKQHSKKMLTSKTVDEFEGNFSAFLATGRSVTLALQKDGGISFNTDGTVKKRGSVDGFADWYVQKQSEMRKDQLCKYFKDARDEDLHTGDTKVESNYCINGPVHLSAQPGKDLIITSRGIYDVAQPNTPKEEHQQRLIGEQEMSQVFLANAPSQHKSIDLVDRSPASLCKLFETYLEELVQEAKEKFFNT